MSGGYNHYPGCGCPWCKLKAQSQRPSTLRLFSFRQSDFCRPTTCPHCKQKVFFIRHNGGSVWVEELGWPWPKHEHFADSTSEDLYGQIKSLKHQEPKAGELQLSGESLVGLMRKVIPHAAGQTYLVDTLDPRSHPDKHRAKLAALQVSSVEHVELSGLVTLHWENGLMLMTDEKGCTVPVSNRKITEEKIREFMGLDEEVL
jgi:hypothetical protein